MALKIKIFEKENPKKLWYFLAASIGISWVLAFIPQVKFAFQITPFLVAFLLSTYNTSDEIKKDFRDRIVDIKRIKKGWLLAVILFNPLAIVCTYGISSSLGFSSLDWECIKKSFSPYLLISTVFLIFPSIFEQGAWRGFVLDRLQLKWGALVASVLTAIFQIVWFLPLFFEGNIMSSMGLFTPHFFMWIIQMISLSIIYTTIYNNNQRSVLIAILFHLLFNLTNIAVCYNIKETNMYTELIRTAIYILTASGAVLYFGTTHLMKSE